VAIDALEPFDRWALADLERFSSEVRAAYEAYEFHTAYQLLVNYCAVQLSGVYLDGLKVRLYIQPAKSAERRSAQTVLHAVLDALVRLMAPILAFTADEVWREQSVRPAEESVHLVEFAPAKPERRDAALETEWDVLMAARTAVMRELEGLRSRKEIGSSQDAALEISAVDSEHQAILERHQPELEEVFIVSSAEVRAEGDAWVGAADEVEEGFRVAVRVADGDKCPRCWRYRTTAGTDSEQPALCAECVSIIS